MSEKKGPWTIRSKRNIYDNRWIQVTHHDVLTPAGDPGVYGTVHFKHWAVAVVPIDADLNTYLVGQYRFPLDRYSWEVPEGGGSLDGDPEESARRELREETGLEAGSLLRLLEADLSNSVTDERATVFLAWDLAQGAAAPDLTERLEVRRLPLTEAFRMIASGEIRDGLSVISLQAVQLMYLENRLPIVSPRRR
jgi:8-oxo-dGTP pyrophosphatase MutT (NUDIX family)